MSTSSPSSPSSAAPLPKKKARIFSNGRTRQRAVVFNPTNYFNGDVSDDNFNFSEPMAPASSFASNHNFQHNHTHHNIDQHNHNHHTKNQQQSQPTSNHQKQSQHNNLSKQNPDNHRHNQQTTTRATRKEAHQCHESGESNQIDTDVEYFIESLDKEKNKLDIRCLSLLGLAKKVMSSEFRMHLKAHDEMPRIISALTDAPKNATLALSCATLLFIHNQDKMSSDIDKEALELMLKLLDVKFSIDDIEKKHRDAILELIKQMQDNGHAKYIKISELTAASLAEETLLGLNSKRAGEWFKEELRGLRGLDFILKTIQDIIDTEDVEIDSAKMNKLERCLNVLESITFQNRCNQEYIIKYDRGSFIDSCLDLLRICKREITTSIDDITLKSFTALLTSTIKFLNNITSESRLSSIIGSRSDFLLSELLLYFMDELQSFLKFEQRSDITMICVCLLINMVEFCIPLRHYLINGSKIHELIDTFYKRVNDAQQTEKQADLLLGSHKKEKMTEAMQDSLINQVIAKSGKHMEHSVIAACLAILFGCIIQDNSELRQQFTSYLGKDCFVPFVDVLQKLHEFAHVTEIMTSTGVNRVKRILKVFKPQPIE